MGINRVATRNEEIADRIAMISNVSKIAGISVATLYHRYDRIARPQLSRKISIDTQRFKGKKIFTQQDCLKAALALFGDQNEQHCQSLSNILNAHIQMDLYMSMDLSEIDLKWS